jgi:hypothetical protein
MGAMLPPFILVGWFFGPIPAPIKWKFQNMPNWKYTTLMVACTMV